MSVILSSSTSPHTFANSPKVIVVGGGIGGLTAAHRLSQAGMDVDLYEAKGRIGGRIFTANINGRIAELGGQNITDGGDATHLNRLIDEFGLKCVHTQILFNQSYFNGTDLTPVNQILRDEKIDPEILKDSLDKLATTALNMKEVLENIVDPQSPLYKILSVRLAGYEGGPTDKLSPFYTETLFHMLLGGICSVHQADRDANTYVDFATIEGGNSQLPQRMGEALGSRLHLNMPLTKVSKAINGRFQLTYQDESEIETDILVLAIPCSVYNDITFENEVIPLKKLEAIQNVHYGENAKILVPFNSAPSITMSAINDECSSFFDRNKQILTIYYTGSTSLFSPQTISKAYAKARPMIEHAFENCPPFTAPTYAKDEADVSYENAIGYSWPNDPYIKGSYSYIACGQEKTLTETTTVNGETFKALFAPIDHLFFVGEHTTILHDVPGTMEAACESGERIAKTIIQNQKK